MLHLNSLTILIRLDLLRRVDNGYRFTIPLLQRWVAENRPLRRVKAELDSLEPQAENLQANAQRKYAEGDLTAAEMSLRRALAINPHHVQARLLLGRVHLDKGNYAEAVAVLESAYKSDPMAARQGLIATLLALADTQKNEDEQWQTLSRILRINPEQSAARQKKDSILRGWAEKAMDEKEFEVALNVYDQLNDGVGTAKARKQLRRQSLARPWNWLSRSQATK